MNTFKIILGVLAGMTAGALLGILFAPEKGSRLRKRIIRTGEDLKDSIAEKMDEKFEDVAGAVKQKMKKAKVNMF